MNYTCRNSTTGMETMNVPLTSVELDMLRRLDGSPPTEDVTISRAVQSMAIRAVNEILQTRLLLTRLIALPFAPGECPYFGRAEWQAEYDRLHADVLAVLHGNPVEPAR